jgi:hypothetical protein
MGANSCVFELSFANEGRAPISKAVVNVVIPEHIHEFKRSDAAGNTHPEGPGTVATTRETLEADARGDPVRSVYWTGLVDFPGRSAKPLFFCVTWVGQRAELPFRVEVTASELDERFDMSGTLFLVT